MAQTPGRPCPACGTIVPRGNAFARIVALTHVAATIGQPVLASMEELHNKTL